ncbi:MAG: MDR family MFS transporter [Candidatus Rokuibacteriota bacterium]
MGSQTVSADGRLAPPPRGAVIFGVMLGLFLGAMESTAVATAMPTVMASLGGLSVYAWVFSGYILAATISMPLWGKCADLYGPRSAYLAGVAIFLAGSVLSGLAPSMTWLIVFRTIQGLGGGALIPLGMTIIADLYGLEQRARMQGYFSATWGLASFVGPLIGGFLTDHLSWHWVFFINVPFGLLAAVVLGWALRGLPRTRERVAVDILGAALLTGGMGCLLVALVEGGRNGAGLRPLDWGLLLGATGLLVGFVAWEQRAPEPLLPLRLFANRMFRAAAVSGFLAGMAMFGTISFIPLFVQGVLGGTATEAGTALTPFVLGWVTFSVIAARLLLKVGYRGPVLVGMVCLALAFLLMSDMGRETSRMATIRNMLVAGIGMGLIMVPLLIAVQNAVPKRDLGAATSATTFFRSIGGAVGVAVMGAVLSSRMAGPLLGLASEAAGLSRAQVETLLVHPALRLTLPPPVREAFTQGLANALHAVFLVGLGIACLALASAFLVPAGRAQDLALREHRVVRPSS